MQAGETIELINHSDYCQPITSFDWNQIDYKTIASASIDSSVTIWNIELREITTQLVAHEKAVYDISFSVLDETIFATVGEDGSVRLFDTRELRNSNIVYENNDKGAGLTHLKWNLRDSNLMAVVQEDDHNVMLFDKRKPSMIIEKLNHENKVTAIAWSPSEANMICSVGEGGRALIWDLNDPNNEGSVDEAKTGAGHAQDSRSNQSLMR